MTNPKLQNLEITTLGWQYPQWKDIFYPDDLPEEWRLDFYLNHFRLVTVPQPEWLNWLVDFHLDEEPFDDFIDCLNENSLVLLVAAEDQLDCLEELLALTQETELYEHLIGCVILAEKRLPPSEIGGVPVSLVSSSLKLAGWFWRSDGVIVSGQPLAWIDELTGDGKKQAELLNDFAASISGQAAPVCIADPKVSMETLQNLKTVAELLGH